MEARVRASAVLDLRLTLAETGEGSGLMWPVGSGTSPFPLALTYGQFEGCDGGRALHYGIDILRMQPAEYVYAMEPGQVTHVRDDSDFWSGVVVRSHDDPSRGFQYLHLDKSSIDVEQGQLVQADDLLGQVLDSYPFCKPHLHLARIAEFAEVSSKEMPGNEYAVRNPLRMIDPAYHSTQKPPALEGQLYVRLNDVNSPQLLDLDLLPAGELDIIIRFEDRDRLEPIEFEDSDILKNGFGLAPFEVELEVRKQGSRSAPLEWLLRLDGRLPLDPLEIYSDHAPLESESCCLTGTFLLHLVPTNAGAALEQLPSASNNWKASEGDYDIFVVLRDAASHEYRRADPVRVSVI